MKLKNIARQERDNNLARIGIDVNKLDEGCLNLKRKLKYLENAEERKAHLEYWQNICKFEGNY